MHDLFLIKFGYGESLFFPLFLYFAVVSYLNFPVSFTRWFGSSAGLFSFLFSFCFSSKVQWGGGFSRCSFLLLNFQLFFVIRASFYFHFTFTSCRGLFSPLYIQSSSCIYYLYLTCMHFIFLFFRSLSGES
jgi:hypothetical protein